MTIRRQNTAGDRDRFQVLCQTLRPGLLRFAFSLSRDLAVAEDVVQETMLRAWKARDSLKSESTAKPWFLTIIRREYARSFERKRFVMVDVDELIAREEPILASAHDLDITELHSALFKLPEKYREPLVLQVLTGCSTAEIAAKLGLSTGAVLTRLFRARNQLRAIFSEAPAEAVANELPRLLRRLPCGVRPPISPPSKSGLGGSGRIFDA